MRVQERSTGGHLSGIFVYQSFKTRLCSWSGETLRRASLGMPDVAVVFAHCVKRHEALLWGDERGNQEGSDEVARDGGMDGIWRRSIR